MEPKDGKEAHSFVAGAVSGFTTRVVVSPLDLMKIRAQLQQEKKSDPLAKYHGFRHMARTVLKDEGIGAFWKGFLPAQALWVSYGFVQFGVYPFILSETRRVVSADQHLSKFVAGGFSSSVATTITFPFDTVRTRMVAQVDKKVYRSMFHALRLIPQQEGILAMYKGLIPALVSVFPGGALQFGIYGWLTSFAILKVPALATMMNGMIAGTVAKVVLLPMDLVKKRLQVQGFESVRIGQHTSYSGFMDCIAKVLQEEGVFAFFKGGGPSVAKAAVGTALSFTIYESMITLLDSF